MFSFPSSLLIFLVLCSPGRLLADADRYGYGQTASESEIAGWDIDVRPDGKGLPPGAGSVEDGEYLYEDKCAQCHGSFGEGIDQYPALAGGEGTLTDNRPHRTVGSYWPYTSTLWDYIHRAMPYLQPESLTDDEVYAITAYVLFLNDLVSDDFILSQENLASVVLPNAANFSPDARPDTKNTRCMTDCKQADTITIVSRVERVTPVATDVVAAAKPIGPGEEIYNQGCNVCHDNALAGAPNPADAADWKKRMMQGRDQLVQHAIEGFEGEVGVMAPKGGFVHLSDEQVRLAVEYMLEQSQ